MSAITVQHLRKQYGHHHVIEDVSFTVEKGQVFGLLGPNGAGKSTTVNCLLGLERFDAGLVRILGHTPDRNDRALRQQVGAQLQHARLPAQLRVGEALQLYASLYDHPADGRGLMERVGLSTRIHTPFSKLSGGQQQRLSLALALIGRPQVVVLDEPTTGLDPSGRHDVWSLIQDCRSDGVTVVLVTHFLEEAERLCDNIAILQAGRVLATGTVAQIIAHHPEPQRELQHRPSRLEDAYLHLLARTAPSTETRTVQ